MIGEIIRSAERAAHLTKQMLAYSGKGRFLVQPVNLSEFTRDLVTLSETLFREPPIGLATPGEVPLVEADIAQLQQLVMNLFINAGEAIGDARDGHHSDGRPGVLEGRFAQASEIGICPGPLCVPRGEKIPALGWMS